MQRHICSTSNFLTNTIHVLISVLKLITKGRNMTDNTKPILEKADKIAIAVMTALFLMISAGIINENNNMQKKLEAQEQLKKLQQNIQTKTLDLSKQK